jgi:hypothetical protein
LYVAGIVAACGRGPIEIDDDLVQEIIGESDVEASGRDIG